MNISSINYLNTIKSSKVNSTPVISFKANNAEKTQDTVIFERKIAPKMASQVKPSSLIDILRNFFKVDYQSTFATELADEVDLSDLMILA